MDKQSENSSSAVWNLDEQSINIINNMPNPVIITNPVDMSTGYVNPAFENLTGFSLADVAGVRAPYPWWPEERHAEYLAELGLVLAGKKHKSDWLFRKKNGVDFWIKAAVAPAKVNGEIKYLLANWVDITENKNAESSLYTENSKMHESDLQVMEGILQKIRDPLTSIKGDIGALLQPGIQREKTEETRILEAAEFKAEHLSMSIENLLAIILIETGKLKLNQRSCRVYEIFQAANPRVNLLTRHHRIKYILPSLLPLVYTDERRIAQVLENLIDDAVMLVPSGSLISIEARVSGDWLVISVMDEGRGNLPENWDKILERFAAVERSSPETISRTGLGFAVARSFVEAHGGKIWAEKLPDKGSKVSFTLPIVREA